MADAEPEQVAATGGDPGEDAVRREAVRAAMRSLDARERELIALRFDGGLSHAEIAEVLDITATNASTMVHRVVTKLRKACDEMA